MTRRMMAPWFCVLAFGCSVSDGGAPDVGPDAADLGFDVGDDATHRACGASRVEEHTVAGWTVRLDHTDGAWRATAADGTVLAGRPACTEAAVLLLDEDASVRHAFGNFQIDLTGEHSWVANEAQLPEFSAGDEVRLQYRVGQNRDAAIVFSEGSKGGLRVELEHATKSAELRFTVEPAASFFGLGTQVTGMDLRGRTFPLWTQEQGNGKPEGGGYLPAQQRPRGSVCPNGCVARDDGLERDRHA